MISGKKRLHFIDVLSAFTDSIQFSRLHKTILLNFSFFERGILKREETLVQIEQNFEQDDQKTQLIVVVKLGQNFHDEKKKEKIPSLDWMRNCLYSLRHKYNRTWFTRDATLALRSSNKN